MTKRWVVCKRSVPGIAAAMLLSFPVLVNGETLGEDGFADSDGVKIHYVTAGKGDLVVMIHGFPDFWYSWRNQMPALAKHFQVVAIDQRGYNKSDQPEGVENYTMDKLVGDVAAVIRHFQRDKAIIVGHDWGGAVAWAFAMSLPEMTERLVILNLPHPKWFSRELATNPTQRANSMYARNFQQPDAAKKVSPEGLARFIGDEAARPKYLEAFKRSSIEGISPTTCGHRHPRRRRRRRCTHTPPGSRRLDGGTRQPGTGRGAASGTLRARGGDGTARSDRGTPDRRTRPLAACSSACGGCPAA